MSFRKHYNVLKHQQLAFLEKKQQPLMMTKETDDERDYQKMFPYKWRFLFRQTCVPNCYGTFRFILNLKNA